MATKTTSATKSEPSDETLRERLAADLEDLGDELQTADRWFRAFVRERPLVALAGAIVAGFAAGRIISRV